MQDLFASNEWIAINSALMILRRRRARPEILYTFSFNGADNYPRLEFEDTAPNPEQLCAQQQQNVGLLRAIQTLEPKLRAPIQFRLADERSLKEIANTLNISVPAVKSRLRRARLRLASKPPAPFSGEKRSFEMTTQRTGWA